MTPRTAREGDYWDGVAASLELSIEGQRLLVAEIAQEIRLLWQRATAWASARMGMRYQ